MKNSNKFYVKSNVYQHSKINNIFSYANLIIMKMASKNKKLFLLAVFLVIVVCRKC